MTTILHAHVLRELLKTFALTLVALTALFTMGGGLYNVLRHEGIDAGDLFAFIPMLIPIVLTLTMPVAALFAVAMVYGRLAADNELLACRAAGLNVHWLFASAGLLAVFVAAFTLLFGDLVIPDFVRRVDHYARANLRNLACQRLQTKGYIRYEPHGEQYLLTARSARGVTETALAEQGLPTGAGFGYLLVDSPVYFQIDENDTLVRYAAARRGLCQFDTRSSPIEIRLFVEEGREFDLRKRSVRLQRQELGPIPVPIPFKRKTSMVDLATLLRWRERPWEGDKLQSELRDFWRDLTRELFIEDGRQRIARGESLELQNERGQTYRVSAAAGVRDRRGLLLNEARVALLDGNPQRPLYYEAPEALLAPRTTIRDDLAVGLQLRMTTRPVVEHNPRASDYQSGRQRANLNLPDEFRIPERLCTEVRGYDPADVFDPAIALPGEEQLSERRAKLQQQAAKERRKISALIHFRLGFTSSTLVTVFMAAALGVIFRGARALAAFGLACIPFGVVAILMVMARQLGEKEGTELLSPLFTWGGLGLVALADVVIVRLGVRR